MNNVCVPKILLELQQTLHAIKWFRPDDTLSVNNLVMRHVNSLCRAQGEVWSGVLKSVWEGEINEESENPAHTLCNPPCQMSFHTNAFPTHPVMHNLLVHAAIVEQSV